MLNAASMPSFMFWPSSLAGPLNGADMPNRTSVSVTPRTRAAGSLPPVLATRAGALLAGSAVGAVAGDGFGCATRGVTGATGAPAAGELASSNREVNSLVLVPEPLP